MNRPFDAVMGHALMALGEAAWNSVHAEPGSADAEAALVALSDAALNYAEACGGSQESELIRRVLFAEDLAGCFTATAQAAYLMAHFQLTRSHEDVPETMRLAQEIIQEAKRKAAVSNKKN